MGQGFDYKSGMAMGIRGTSAASGGVKSGGNAGNALIKQIRSGKK